MAIKIAAASLIGRYSVSETALQILRIARTNTKDPWEQTHLEVALCESLAKARKWADLLLVSNRLMASKMFSDEGFQYFVKAASGSKRWQELQSAAERRLKGRSTNWVAMRAMATARARLGDAAGAADWIKKTAVSNLAGVEERIFEAWNAMASGKADEEVLSKLQEAKERGGTASAEYHYALAMLQAVLQMPEDAHQSLLLALSHEDFSSLDPRAWAVYGKVCEQYGFSKEAAAAFALARAGTSDDELTEWELSTILR